MLLHLKDEDFKEEIKEGLIIVDFYADWCGPCKMLAPVLEEIASETDIKIIKVNVDEHDTLAREYGVLSIPTILFLKDNELITKNIGFMSKDKILDTIKEIN